MGHTLGCGTAIADGSVGTAIAAIATIASIASIAPVACIVSFFHAHDAGGCRRYRFARSPRYRMFGAAEMCSLGVFLIIRFVPAMNINRNKLTSNILITNHFYCAHETDMWPNHRVGNHFYASNT